VVDDLVPVVSTVTIQLAAPAAWRDSLQAAGRDWPDAVLLDVQQLGDSWPSVEPVDDDVLVRALAVGGASVTLGPLTSRPGSALATIVGSAPMSASSLSAWAKRALLGTANPAMGPALAWSLPHDVNEMDLPGDARASHHARTAIRTLAAGMSCFDDVLLATSELTANALQHGGGSPHLTTVRGERSIVVALTDRRPDLLPMVLPMRGTVASSGRGMAIVEAISAHWGVTVYHDRKVVWCELLAH
jgi:anti-sigma regulatory factor (Ser/Thr protein kinase)